MPTTITGTDGVSQVQDGAVTASDLTSTLDLSGKAVTLPAGVGGKVLQVVQSTTDTQVVISAGSGFTDTTLNASITPSNASNKVLIITNQLGTFEDSTTADGDAITQLVRNSTSIYINRQRHKSTSTSTEYQGITYSVCYLDSPNTTSAVTYKTQVSPITGDAYLQHGGAPYSSSMILMEIAG